MKKTFELQWPNFLGEDFFTTEKLLNYISTAKRILGKYVQVDVVEIKIEDFEE
ncbi:hypothetical protein LCGC14_1909290 [marine sediment metagenome]|uniref:Uncharacterized protein n=1 Tax=marine sediment metagenome TaxID=412755 RepID=A0A0F9IS60_9ZZZZ